MQPNNTANDTSPAPVPMATPINPGGDIIFNDKPKKKTGIIIGILFLVLLAAGGIGFGIWAYLDGNQKTANLNNQISVLQNQLANQPEIDETIVDVNTNSDVNIADYIYVGEWGLKIKIPDNLLFTSYSFRSDSDALDISGAIKTSDNEIAVPDFAKIPNSVLGIIERFPIDEEIPQASGPMIVFSDNNYKYGYYHPQSVYSTDEASQQWEVNSVDLIQQILTNEDNYSKI